MQMVADEASRQLGGNWDVSERGRPSVQPRCRAGFAWCDGSMIPVFGNAGEVEYTEEIRRILAIPRRIWTDEAAEELARVMTLELKTPRGTMSLRPRQAIALYEAVKVGGMFGPLAVGAGKTLVSLLLPAVFEAKRPVLLLPAGLIEKTWHDRKILAEHWNLPTNLQIISYEMMGRVAAAERLGYVEPDLIIADECHRIFNPRAGVSRRIRRFMNEYPTTKFVGMSGTIHKRSLKDFAPALRWALKNGAPVPVKDDEVTTWADAIDEKVNPMARRRPGALLSLSPDIPAADPLTRARQAFQARLLETPGVVASAKLDGVTCSLLVQALEYDVSQVTVGHITNIRATWATPDGWTFSEALELRRYVRELAVGFHGVWDPRPKPEWLAARREWASFVRDILTHSRTLDTELQVANAVDAGRLDKESLTAWRAIRDTFTINPKPVWHDDSALQACSDWTRSHKGIVWCEHRFFAQELSRRTGLAYYGADGLDGDGNSITLVKPGKAIIASIQANGTGRNLQMFSENLITSCPSGPSIMEQLLGRTHRDGQVADEVLVDILVGCREHVEAFQKALDGAKATADTIGASQKLLLADIVMPDISQRRGPLWA